MSTQQPAQHADRDGSERRRSMEREHERGLAADVAEPEACRTIGYLAGAFTQYLFDACPNCGHTRMAHPGRHNPRVTSCVICRLEGLTG